MPRISSQRRFAGRSTASKNMRIGKPGAFVKQRIHENSGFLVSRFLRLHSNLIRVDLWLNSPASRLEVDVEVRRLSSSGHAAPALMPVRLGSYHFRTAWWNSPIPVVEIVQVHRVLGAEASSAMPHAPRTPCACRHRDYTRAPRRCASRRPLAVSDFGVFLYPRFEFGYVGLFCLM